MSESLKAGTVYTGRNEIRINCATMNRLILDWLHVNHSGGPYEVQSVKWDSNHSQFVITFDDVEKGTP